MQYRLTHFLMPETDALDPLAIQRVNFDPASLDATSLQQLPESLQRHTSRQRQAAFLAGRLAAKAALQAAGYTGMDVPGIGVQREPLWPAGYCGSITHHQQQALAVAAPISDETAGIGLDLEGLMSDSVAGEIADELLATAAEKQWVTAGLLPHATLMTLIFSAKESLFKALFPQVQELKAFAAASLVAVSSQSATFTLALNEDWSPQLPAGKRFQGCWQLQPDQLVTLIRV